jgi:hypothetical protein
MGLLIQGSVQPPPVKLSRSAWETAMQTVATRQGGVQWSEFLPDAVLRAEVEKLRSEKYSQAAFNQKR